jgi:CRP-like cAMP-binding protein
MFQEAERKARLRDIQNEKVLTEEEMKVANELQTKAQARGMKLVPERKVKSKVRFVQFLQTNWDYLRENGYLTSEEKVFLVDIQAYIGLHSNAIVDDVNKKNPMPLNQTQIAELLRTSKTKISRVVNNLVKKGILTKAESGIEGNNVRAYTLFVNPNIIFAGDKDSVNESLKVMFRKPMSGKLKDLPDRLF